MPSLSIGGSAPTCPMCDGPCTEAFTRSHWRIPDRLPRANPLPPAPVPAPRNRGRRAHRPSEDRMQRLSEDRAV